MTIPAPGSFSGVDPVDARAALRIAIMTDETGWHTGRLKKAFRARGAEARCIDLADCRIDTTWEPHGLMLPGFGHGLPDAVFVRGIAGGTFEQVTLRLGILHALRECGVPVYNDARAIERSVDKSMTSFLLHRNGVPTPATWAGESAAFAQRVLMREAAAGRQVVLKPLFGSQGHGLKRLGARRRSPWRADASAFAQALSAGCVSAALYRWRPSGLRLARAGGWRPCRGGDAAGRRQGLDP